MEKIIRTVTLYGIDDDDWTKLKYICIDEKTSVTKLLLHLIKQFIKYYSIHQWSFSFDEQGNLIPPPPRDRKDKFNFRTWVEFMESMKVKGKKIQAMNPDGIESPKLKNVNEWIESH